MSYCDFIIKVGDKNDRLRHGLVSQVIYEEDAIYSEWMKTVYLILRCPREWGEIVQSDIQLHIDEKDFDNLYQYGIIWDDFESLTGIADIENYSLSAFPVEVVDCRSFQFEEVFQIIDKSELLPVNDNNAITSGTYSWGTSQTYSNFKAAYDDCGTQTGTLTLEQGNDSTETTEGCVDHDMNGNDFNVTNADPHDGDPTNGHKVTSSGSREFICINGLTAGSGTPKFTVKDISFQYTGSSFGGDVFDLSGITDNLDVYIHDILLDTSNYSKGISLNDSDIAVFMFNIAADELNSYFFRTPSAEPRTSKIQNCSARNRGLQLDYTGTAGQVEVRNCFFDEYPDIGQGNGYNNISTDGSCADANWNIGSGNDSASQPFTDSFISTSYTSSDFFKLKTSGTDAQGFGTSTGLLTENDHGIRKNDRPDGNGDVSAGPDEYTIASSTVFPWWHYLGQN